jgi:hypothetical protein
MNESINQSTDHKLFVNKATMKPTVKSRINIRLYISYFLLDNKVILKIFLGDICMIFVNNIFIVQEGGGIWWYPVEIV